MTRDELLAEFDALKTRLEVDPALRRPVTVNEGLLYSTVELVDIVADLNIGTWSSPRMSVTFTPREQTNNAISLMLDHDTSYSAPAGSLALRCLPYWGACGDMKARTFRRRPGKPWNISGIVGYFRACFEAAAKARLTTMVEHDTAHGFHTNVEAQVVGVPGLRTTRQPHTPEIALNSDRLGAVDGYLSPNGPVVIAGHPQSLNCSLFLHGVSAAQVNAVFRALMDSGVLDV